MVMANDLGDLSVVSDVRQDSLADCCVLFHLTSLIQREGTGLLQKTHGQPDLSDVVNETTKMHEFLLVRCQAHPLRDIARVDRHGGGMASGVPISSVKRGNQGGGEREVRVFKTTVRGDESLGTLSLLAVEQEKPLCRECRDHEQHGTPRRNLAVRVRKNSDERRVQRDRGQ